MSDAVRLRPARPADASALAAFARASFAETYAPSHDAARIQTHCQTVLADAAVHAWLTDPAQSLLLAEDAGQLVGFVQWQRAPAPLPARHAVEVKRLYVAARAHGRGLGRRLLDAVRATAITDRADLLWLCVYAGNARALRFYSSYGFTEIGRVPYTFVDQTEDDLALGLRLADAPP
ncbi:MAG: GNAT family N-acetyltransferase [Xanthomonadales bacterium]|nr:GNAT family N-acetyltransferase [Xanthomonadales bacterium]MBK7146207.1 GNAT family N-acetyltransferase [Xanthomonadales bacterium]MCC6562236.1 GNAT family N-acetyltransferase [Xanthomonadales bacterium]